MKRSRFTEEQIIDILKEQEAGSKTVDVCRRHGISDATFYKWKAKYGGLDVSEAKRLKALEDENSRLKKLLADAMLDNAVLKELAGKNGDARREAGSARPCPTDVRAERTPGVWDRRDCATGGALSIDATGGWTSAAAPAGVGWRAATLRLPASWLSAGSRGAEAEP